MTKNLASVLNLLNLMASAVRGDLLSPKINSLSNFMYWMIKILPFSRSYLAPLQKLQIGKQLEFLLIY